MDFFAQQDHARRRTWWLVVMFFGAIIGIIAAVYIAIATSFAVAAENGSRHAAHNPMWDPEIFVTVAVIVCFIVLIGTLYKLSQLRNGGAVVAEMLGGHRIMPGSGQYHERRLLNVVEEMALASGVPVPPVYVMTGQMGINAFAAGYSIQDAVVGVTEGAMRGLKRDELQGVIGHEFSHILNGDMRLNIRLIGIIHGLLLLAIIGRVMIRLAANSRSRSSKKDNSAAIFLFIGLALLIVGYAGYFFGGLIKRAVSRQREYLADASAVQFTRNPGGLAAALKKVGGLQIGGQIDNARAEELSHMFFADGIKRFFAGGLFATHPPLAKRIQALDPAFNGEFEPLTEQELIASGVEAEPAAARPAATARAPIPVPHRAAILDRVGLLNDEQLVAAGALLARVPGNVHQLARDPLGAQAVVIGLTAYDADGELPAAVAPLIPDDLAALIAQHKPALTGLDSRARLALLDLAMPAIRTLNADEARGFLGLIERIINADGEVNLFEFAVSEIVRGGLRETLKARIPRIVHHRIEGVLTEACLLLKIMAYVGQPDAAAESAYRRAIEALGATATPPPYGSPTAQELAGIRGSLDALLASSMAVRRKLLEAALACLMFDANVQDQERELFRVIAAALEVPIPANALA